MYSLFCSDYGYMPANGLDGPCVRDDAVPLDDPCADGQVKTVMKSRGYRKIAGDVCTSEGNLVDFEPYEFTCCNVSVIYVTEESVVGDGDKATVTGLAVGLAVVVVVALILGCMLTIVVL